MIRPIAISAVLALFSVTEAQPLFDAPIGLTARNAPDISGTPLKKVEKYSDEDGLVQVTILVYPPITHLEGAKEFVDGTISGMSNKGFKTDQVTDIKVRGFESKKIEGVFSSDSYEGKYKATTLAIFSSDSVYGLALSVHDSARFDSSIEELAQRLSIAGKPLLFENGPEPPSTSFQVGEKIGEILGYVVIALAIFLIAKRLNRKKEKDEAQ